MRIHYKCLKHLLQLLLRVGRGETQNYFKAYSMSPQQIVCYSAFDDLTRSLPLGCGGGGERVIMTHPVYLTGMIILC